MTSKTHGVEPARVPPIPEHHRQWFNTMLAAAQASDVALVSCLDAKTGEPRSVICLMSRQPGGGYAVTPIGHLCPEPNPYLAYVDPTRT
jgi:CelD/BcsL family acetyltransferase involved in cellulose biosynthesis